MAKTILLLGSNLGDRKYFLEQACMLIENNVGKIIRQSAIYETEPWGYHSEMKYLNQVIEVETEFSPANVLQKVSSVEKAMGRTRLKDVYADRNIDVDILFYDDLIYSDELLQIPHPRLHERKFTLEPLCEICPEYVHPVLGKSCHELLLHCNDKSRVKKINKFF